MKRTKKNRQAECLQTGKSERTAANAAKCANGYGQEKTGSDFRKDEGRGKPLSVFLEASEIKTRQCIYISREIHEKVTIVASRMGNYNPQIEMFARFKMKSSFHKTKRII